MLGTQCASLPPSGWIEAARFVPPSPGAIRGWFQETLPCIQSDSGSDCIFATNRMALQAWASEINCCWRGCVCSNVVLHVGSREPETRLTEDLWVCFLSRLIYVRKSSSEQVHLWFSFVPVSFIFVSKRPRLAIFFRSNWIRRYLLPFRISIPLPPIRAMASKVTQILPRTATPDENTLNICYALGASAVFLFITRGFDNLR